MSNHVIYKCAHGTVAGQCRCPAKDKRVQIVPCPSHCTQNVVIPVVVTAPDGLNTEIEFEPNAYPGAGVLIVPDSLTNPVLLSKEALLSAWVELVTDIPMTEFDEGYMAAVIFVQKVLDGDETAIEAIRTGLDSR